jgi:hypothetical protein
MAREFGEDCRESMLRTNIDTEFVVPATEILYEGVSNADYPHRAQSFEPAHWS